MASVKIKVGLVGENANDTDALKALLERQYAGQIQCVPMASRITGDQLAGKNPHARKILAAAYLKTRPDIVVYSRDLDSSPTDTTKRQKRQQEFDHFNVEAFEQRGLLLLHVFELEALIMADIEAFNKRYRVTYRPSQADVMRIVDPKRELRRATNQRYEEEHAAELLEKADYLKLLQGCRYFRDFDTAFAARLKPPKRHS